MIKLPRSTSGTFAPLFPHHHHEAPLSPLTPLPLRLRNHLCGSEASTTLPPRPRSGGEPRALPAAAVLRCRPAPRGRGARCAAAGAAPAPAVRGKRPGPPPRPPPGPAGPASRRGAGRPCPPAPQRPPASRRHSAHGTKRRPRPRPQAPAMAPGRARGHQRRSRAPLRNLARWRRRGKSFPAKRENQTAGRERGTPGSKVGKREVTSQGCIGVRCACARRRLGVARRRAGVYSPSGGR